MHRRLLGLVLLCLAAPACDDPAGAEPDVAALEVDLLVRPATGFEEVWVTVAAVYLQAGTDPTDTPDSRVYLLEDGTSGWDLVANAGQTVQVVRAEDVPAGSYRYIRLVVSQACLTTGDGQSFSSSEAFPPCGQDHDGPLHLGAFPGAVGVAEAPLELQAGDDVTVTLAFDVAESLGRTEDGFILLPQLELQP